MTEQSDTGQLEQIIDHQASLQTQLDAMHLELLAWAAWGAAVSLLVALLAWKLRIIR